MGKFTTGVDALRLSMKDAIRDRIERFGDESEFNGRKCLRVEGDGALCLDSGRCLREAHNSQVVDDQGHEYGYGALSTYDLAKLADWVNETY